MSGWLRWVIAAAMSSGLGCGCTATPIPEPPADTLDFGRIHSPEVLPTTTMLEIVGDPGAGPPGCILRVTNLENQELPVDAVIQDDGSFGVGLAGQPLDELRFQTRDANGRDLPIDVVWGVGPVTDPNRIGCVTLTPLQEQDFGAVASGSAPAARTITVGNACTDLVQVTAARLRRAEPAFAIAAGAPTLPHDLAPTESLAWSLELAPLTAGDTEEILLELTHLELSVRYPITLYGDGT